MNLLLPNLSVLAVDVPALAYIGPGAGFAVMGSFLILLAAVLFDRYKQVRKARI